MKSILFAVFFCFFYASICSAELVQVDSFGQKNERPSFKLCLSTGTTEIDEARGFSQHP